MENKKIIAIVTILCLVAVVIFFTINNRPNVDFNNTSTSTPQTTGKENLIRVNSPELNKTIQSPLVVTGAARGYWFFEASFPIKIVDENGQIVGTGIAQAQDEWMTENFVPFKATITFKKPDTPTGTIILEKDNPSGLPEHDDQLSIPIKFNLKDEALQRKVKLYYYNPSLDIDAQGNILCSKKGLVAVEREIPISISPIQDTIKLLIQGKLTPYENNLGISTEYPLSGFSLSGAILNNGLLTLTFVDEQNKTSGGSCRASILSSQIEMTAKQFPEVTSIKILPKELFQP